MTVHNSNIYKLGKAVVKKTPEAIELLDLFYTKLQPFSILRQVRLLMIEIKHSRGELVLALDNAKKVVQSKGMVKK